MKKLTFALIIVCTLISCVSQAQTEINGNANVKLKNAVWLGWLSV